MGVTARGARRGTTVLSVSLLALGVLSYSAAAQFEPTPAVHVECVERPAAPRAGSTAPAGVSMSAPGDEPHLCRDRR